MYLCLASQPKVDTVFEDLTAMPILGIDSAFVVRGEGMLTLKLIAVLTKIQTRAFQKHRTPVDKCRNAMAGQCNWKGSITSISSSHWTQNH
jgi:hypothetical protein